MEGKGKKRLILLLAFSLAPLSLFAQTAPRDSLVRLMKATSVQLIEKFGVKYRKAVDATFLHNGTYVICDTALWNVDSKTINAEGHVKVMQDETLLTSDRLDYYIERDLAQFRGSLVELTDKDFNTLRTRNLDYNTRDSVAVFRMGGAMRDKDGQIIESDEGEYDSKIESFTFRGNVNMFTDSVFVRTSKLLYESPVSKAWFNAKIDFWKDGNMLSADRGWYDRGNELFFFHGTVHAQSEEQEAWSDSLYFDRNTTCLTLLGRAQIQDTTRSSTAVADYIFYEDSLSQVTMRRNAAVAFQTNQDGQTDTLFFGADTLVYRSVRMCDISEDETAASKERLEDMLTDPVMEYRRKAAAEAAAAAAEAAKNNPNFANRKAGGPEDPGSDEGQDGGDQPSPEDGAPQDAPSPTDSLSGPADNLPAPMDSLGVPSDSLFAAVDSLPAPPLDSLELARLDSLARADSLAALPPPDTTKIGFLMGKGSVKVFREDIQVKCDSMRYCDLDSIARFYIDPVVWNDGNRQYSSDSLFVMVRDGRMERASLLSEAFIITQEDTICYDQIKGTEVVAYFDTTAALSRLDALGGATAMFYLQENGAFATVNKVECKMLSAWFKEGQIDRVYYFEEPHNDAYPFVQLPKEDRKMKGFNWDPESRPKSRYDITELEVKKSQRAEYDAHPKATFVQADKYFPGYISGVYREIAVRDSLKRIPKPKPAPVADSLAAAVSDSLGVAADSVSVRSDSLAVRDSLGVSAPKDSLAASLDSLGNAVRDSLAAADSTSGAAMTEKEIKAARKAEAKAAREAKAKARVEAREARWAELDARDAAKAEAKAAKALEKKREATRKALEARDRREAIDNAKFEKYKARYEKKKAKQNKKNGRKEEPVPSGELSPEAETGGEIPAPSES